MPSLSKAIISLVLATAVLAAPTPQLAGEGAAANSIFSSTDNGVGYGIENAEDNIAGLISGLRGGANTPAAPGSGSRRRQLDKISNGAQAIGQALGVGSSTSGTTTVLDNVDGDLTSGAANLGAQIGQTEESTLEDLGKAVPKL
ncbi:hypothetical protein BKA66DRAFT_442445 [Pyrenochaeta sp. MPI-SDFR-AT-0127]|nr:hypothetical protein BKA66DRAFT_442445 [Pyrenochaeta sp. MPI-SDFR-AT-0127]